MDEVSNKELDEEKQELSPNYYSLDFYQKRKKSKFKLTFAPSTYFCVADTHCHIEMFDKPEWTFVRAAFHNIGFLACVIDSLNDGPDGISKVDDAYKKAQELIPNILKQLDFSNSAANEPIIIKLGDSPELCLDRNSICKNPKLPDYRYIIGTHPHYAKDFDVSQEQKLIEMLKNPKACCVGEIGLDYHYDFSPRKDQVNAFKRQLQIADELGFPVALHLREAHKEALEIFDELGFSKHGTLLHCFNLGENDLKPWVDAGCYIAIGGPVTFKKSDYIRDAIHLIPNNKLLTETDAPFMTPEPLRGDDCFPDHVIFTADVLADVTGNSQNKQMFYNSMYENAQKLLNRDLLPHQK